MLFLMIDLYDLNYSCVVTGNILLNNNNETPVNRKKIKPIMHEINLLKFSLTLNPSYVQDPNFIRHVWTSKGKNSTSISQELL